MTKQAMNRPIQKVQPYAPRHQPVRPAQSAGSEENAEELSQFKSSLNAGPVAQRLQSLQLAANSSSPTQRAGDEEEMLQGKLVQRMEDEEMLQGKMIQRAGEDEEMLQGKLMPSATVQPVQAKQEDAGGLPGQLKAGIESLSGMSMDGVQVHRNSSAPAAVQAHAYAQGTDIHLGPGQEKHLPHEAWHVVQQAQGRVKPTMQAKGVAINDDPGLEHEADVMGARAMSVGSRGPDVSEA